MTLAEKVSHFQGVVIHAARERDKAALRMEGPEATRWENRRLAALCTLDALYNLQFEAEVSR